MFNEKFEKCLITFLPVRLITLKNMYAESVCCIHQLSMKDTRIYCQLVVHPDCQKDDEGMISASIKLASICSCKIEKNIYLSILFFLQEP